MIPISHKRHHAVFPSLDATAFNLTQSLKIKLVFSAMKRTKVTNKSDMAELEHKSFQDRLEQKGKTPNFIRKSRARLRLR